MAKTLTSRTQPRSSRILVIDDEQDMLTNYRRLLQRAGHECVTASDAERLEEMLEEFKPDLVVTDLLMPNNSGLDVIQRVHQAQGGIPVILVTAYGSIGGAVEAMKKRAADYLTKPFSAEDLLGRIHDALSTKLMQQSEQAAAGEHEVPEWRQGIIGISPAINHVLGLANKVARTDVNVLVVGESGTGKEVFARAIHRLSPRRKEIFVPVDCASLPENLLESELFGYTKGAFTGANSDKMGLFEFAHKGTLFLDEIGEIPIALQSKLLRVLQERQFRPIGGRKEVEVDVRMIAATNRDLDEALREKTFRSDLYYRLNVVTIRLPPLRERREDIPLLAAHFLRQFARENHLDKSGFSTQASDCLKEYDWPGNVRELQNVVEHAATLAGGVVIQAEDLPEILPRAAINAEAGAAKGSLFAEKNQLVGLFERDYLISLLVDNQFNISRAAAAAGCHRRTLYRMIHRYDLDLRTLKEQRRSSRKPVNYSGENVT